MDIGYNETQCGLKTNRYVEGNTPFYSGSLGLPKFTWFAAGLPCEISGEGWGKAKEGIKIPSLGRAKKFRSESAAFRSRDTNRHSRALLTEDLN